MPGNILCALSLLCACAAVNLLLYGLLYQTDVRSPSLNQGRIHVNSVATVPMLTSRKGQGADERSALFVQGASSPTDERLFQFPVNPYRWCAKKLPLGSSKWRLVTMVISAVDNFSRRDAIRHTWGSTGSDVNSTLLFLVGIKTGDTRVQMQVVKEAELYGDVIQVDIEEDYDNLTLKSIAMLQWFNDYCFNAEFYLKADDDVYVNIENLLSRLSITGHRRFFLCHVFREAPPARNKKSKWYVPFDQFPGRRFPTYCSGTAYSFSSLILTDLYRRSRKMKYIRMEDVYITGLSAKDVGVTHIHDGGFSFVKRKATGCDFEKVLSGHEMSEKEMFVIFSQLMSKEIDCKKNINLYLQKVEAGEIM